MLPLLGPLYADNGQSGAGGIPLFEGAASGLPPGKNVLWLLIWVLPALSLSLRSLLSMVDDEEILPPGTKQMLDALGLPDDTGDTKDAKATKDDKHDKEDSDAEDAKGPGKATDNASAKGSKDVESSGEGGGIRKSRGKK